MAGGGLSTEPHIAQNLGVFVKPEQAMEVMEAVTRTYRDYGYRKNRKHARLKYLVADWGVEKFREEFERSVGYKLPDAEPTTERRMATRIIGCLSAKAARPELHRRHR
jgi:sulfite reductase beta subunit-like hemoprotein